MSASLAAIVLAAGRSDRMGFPKGKLLWRGQPLLAHACEIAFAAGCHPIVAVVGEAEATDRQLISAEEARQLLGARLSREVTLCVGAPNRDPMASIRRGLAQIPEGLGLLLWPVDYPFADEALTSTLCEAVARAPDCIAMPTYKCRSGHPIAFGGAVVPELRSYNGDEGARAVVRRVRERRIAVPCDDGRITQGCNTPQRAQSAGLVRPGSDESLNAASATRPPQRSGAESPTTTT